jgi:hypothetical protein
MKELTFTLVTDGSSDVVLLPILTWLLRVNGVALALQPIWADMRRANLPPRANLAERLRVALDLFPCDLLFVHRDAERQPRAQRVAEIEKALSLVPPDLAKPEAVCVVPVRMQEAWLLFDELAIKQAAGNGAFKEGLDLPSMREIEALPNPKAVLHDRLRRASGLHGRRLRTFPAGQRARRVAELIDDFSPLRALSAFHALEEDIDSVVSQFGWAG